MDEFIVGSNATAFTIMQHVKSYGNIRPYRYLTKMYWACSMTEHCDLTMQLCNTSDQRGKRSVALNYYALARRSSTKDSTQQSALTLKYWQNASYQLRGMNNWLYAVMTISAHWFNICSHIWEGVRRLSPSLVTCLATVTDGHMAGVGNLRVGNKYRPCKHGPCTGPSPAGVQWCPAPNLTFGLLVAVYIQCSIFKMWPPFLVFGPSFWFLAPPACFLGPPCC